MPIRGLGTTRVGLKFENPPVCLNSSPVSSVDGADQFWKVDIVSIICLFRMPNSDPLSVYHCYFIIQCAKLILVLRGPDYISLYLCNKHNFLCLLQRYLIVGLVLEVGAYYDRESPKINYHLDFK